LGKVQAGIVSSFRGFDNVRQRLRISLARRHRVSAFSSHHLRRGSGVHRFTAVRLSFSLSRASVLRWNVDGVCGQLIADQFLRVDQI